MFLVFYYIKKKLNFEKFVHNSNLKWFSVFMPNDVVLVTDLKRWSHVVGAMTLMQASGRAEMFKRHCSVRKPNFNEQNVGEKK